MQNTQRWRIIEKCQEVSTLAADLAAAERRCHDLEVVINATRYGGELFGGHVLRGELLKLKRARVKADRVIAALRTLLDGEVSKAA